MTHTRWHLLALACTLLVLGACGRAPAEPTARTADLGRLHAACVDAMLKSTCQVMSGPAAANDASVVFVAGLGAVDAAAYRELRASGDAMCGTVLNACKKDWSGSQCKTARGLWPDAASAR